MVRKLILPCGAVVLAALFVGTALAQSNTSAAGSDVFARGPGGYLSWIKLLLSWLLFLLWIKTTDWVNRDCQLLRLPYAIWNSVVYFPFLVGLLVFMWTVPLFLIGFPLALLTWAVPLGVYVAKRNTMVQRHERVMTPHHIRYMLATQGKSLGLKVDVEKRAGHELGAPVKLEARGGGSDQADQSNLIAARQTQGFLPAKQLIAQAVDRRADKIMLDYDQQSVAVRYQVDGVWHDGEPLEREEGDGMLVVLKKISALNVKERRARQEGSFHAQYNGASYDASLVTQGTKTGERVIIGLGGEVEGLRTLEELGMRDKMRDDLKALLAGDRGMILFSSLPSGGLSTTVTAALRAADRYTRDFASVLEKNAREPDVENVEIVRYNESAGQTPANVLPTLIRKQPNVVVVRDLPNAETVKILCDASRGGKLIVSTIRAKEAVEALLRVLLLKVPAADFAPVATAVVNQRLVRRLCSSCKEAYTPPAELLKKLGVPAGRVESLYRPPENPEEICEDCGGIGYRGRTSIFELLRVDERVRQVLVKDPKLETLRKAAREAGNRTLQEEGIVLVVRGVTSLPELTRVLKQ